MIDAGTPRAVERFSGPLHVNRIGPIVYFGTAIGPSPAASTARGSVVWRNWLVLSRIEAEDGRAAAAVRDYRRARSLNPLSPFFER